MRVLLVSDFYPPRISGIAQHVRRLAVNLAKRGHEVQVLVSDPLQIEIENDENVKVARSRHIVSDFRWMFVDKEMRYVPPVPDFRLKRAIMKAIKSFDPDVVHTHGWVTFTGAVLKNQLRHLPVISTLHDYGFFCPNQTGYNMKEKGACFQRETQMLGCLSCARLTHGFVKALAITAALSVFRKFLNNLDGVVAVSNYLRNTAIKAGLNNIRVIPNFIDLSEMETIEKSCLGDRESFSTDILYVGTLAPYKGAHILLRAHKMLTKDFDVQINLTLIGRSDSKWSFNTLASGINVVADMPGSVVFSYMGHTKMVVIPSIWPEVSSLASLEAMFFRKPVIASAIGGLREIIEDTETGLLVPPSNHFELANAIRHLFENSKRANCMGMRGHERIVKYFSAEKVVPQIENIYRNVSRVG